jgi:DNA helicase HerA-like ATPase
MVEKIIVGRDRPDLERYGERGTVFIGKHIVGEGEDAHLTNPVYMDVTRPHVMLVCGKRGSGKSYSSGVIAEEMTFLPQEIRQNLSILMIDTMGIYWSMKRPNEKDRSLLERWGLKPRAMDMRFFVPKGFAGEYKKSGINFDFPFTLPCGEISSTDWIVSFGFSPMDDYGLLTERVISRLQKESPAYSIKDIIRAIGEDPRADRKVRDALISRFMSAEGWGIFEREGTPVERFFSPGRISVIDISHYVRSGLGWSVRSMVIGLLARRVFQARLMARKREEVEVITGEKRKSVPMVWIMVDEAHQFIASQGVTAATEPMLTLVKEGREPGISLLLITQIPNKLHPDVLAQSDIVLSHRLTSEADINALQAIMQSYAKEDIQTYINSLPRTKGSAVILDDNSERIFPIQVRPRLSWHAGGSPKAIRERGIFDEA